MIRSKKYQGVYHRKRKDGEITYYFTYQNEFKKTQFQKVGIKSQGIDEAYVNELRLKTISTIKTGELPPKIVRNNRYKTTVDEISKFYFDNHITVSSEKRLRQYNYRLKDFFGHMSIYNVNSKHIEQFRDKMIKEVSSQTTIVYLELLSTLYNFYIKHHQIKLINPVAHIQKPRIDNRRERFLSKQEIDLVFMEISNNFTMTLFLALSLSTGARKSTILNYSIKDIDLSHNMINSYDFKNKSTYKSFLDKRTIELLKIRMAQTNNLDDKIIYNNDVKDINRWISRVFKIIFDNLFNQNLDVNDRKNRVVLHTLRHTVLSHLGMNGSNEFLIKKISNHQSTQMVNRYVKLSEDTGRNEIEKLWN